MSLTAEIIAVGNELLLGTITNTNARDITEALTDLGISVLWHTVVGDDPIRLRQTLELARSRADVIVTTGGLGPTYDDLTKQTICETFGKKLVLHQDILDDIRTFYEGALHVPMPENNTQQAELPEGCVIFDNPNGTAPGCAFEADGTHVLMLPGPPNEMLPMLKNHGAPYLKKLSHNVIVSRDIMTFGMGESSVEQLLREKHMTAMTNPTLATYAKPAEVRLRATATAETAEAAEALLAPVVEEVKTLLGDVVYGVDKAGLEVVCKELLLEKGLTFATAESCTGGRVAQRITSLPGASGVYRGGVVSYWTDVKGSVLGVPREILDEFGAVSEETARAMAEGVRRKMNADIAVSATGMASPGNPDEPPAGTVFVGIASAKGVRDIPLRLTGDRMDIRRQTVKAALNAILTELTQ